MIFKLIILLLSGVLFAWGGYNWHNARRFILPILLAGTCFYITHSYYCLFQLAVIGSFCLGYGDKSPLRHIFGNGWGRSVWGLLAAIFLSLPLFLTHYLAWYFFIIYLAINFTLENALKDINQIIGDLIIGFGFASIIFLI